MKVNQETKIGRIGVQADGSAPLPSGGVGQNVIRAIASYAGHLIAPVCDAIVDELRGRKTTELCWDFCLKYPLTVLGGIVAPLALLMTLAALAFGGSAGDAPSGLRTFWLPLHVTLAFLGNAVFALAFAVSLVYLLQERDLKHKRITALMKRFPSLESLDRLNYRLLVWGFPLMTLGIITGSLWAGLYWGDYWSWEPRQISSGLVWLFYGALLHARMTAGLRGKKAALLTMLGFCVVLGYFLMGDTLFPGRHGGRFE